MRPRWSGCLGHSMTSSIDLDRLWLLAEESVGLSLPKSGNIHVDGLRCLASAMERCNPDARASRLLRRDVFAWILAYLNFAKDRTLYGDAAYVPMNRPLFIAAFGRTGSTLLHNLLALDPNARAPRLWELWTPSPPPQPEIRATDPRIETAQRRLHWLARIEPRILEMHPMTAEGPDECHWMMRHSPQKVVLYPVGEYWTWLTRLGLPALRELYGHYKLQAQYLQLFCPGSHWVSKAFSHLFYLPVLFDVFPDARVVRLHRHPCRSIASLCDLTTRYRRLYSDRVDTAEIGPVILDLFLDGAEKSIALDHRFGLQRSHVVDVQYAELLNDPIGVVRRIYRDFDYPYGAEFERDMMHFTERNAGAAGPRRVYSLEPFGLLAAAVAERSKDYISWVEDRTGELVDM
jgi:Sulfotransferase family